VRGDALIQPVDMELCTLVKRLSRDTIKIRRILLVKTKVGVTSLQRIQQIPITTARKLATNGCKSFDPVVAVVTKLQIIIVAGSLSFFQHARKYSNEISPAAIHRRA
jgi:hypothetical protein